MVMTIIILLTMLMLMVMVCDASTFIIPNWLNLAVFALYPLFVWLSPVPIEWTGACYAFLLFFMICLGIYALGLMGGGDIKLLLASSVWFGWNINLLYFIVYTAMAGGVLSMLLLVVRPLCAGVATKRAASGAAFPRVFVVGQPVPYGIAIAIAFLFVMWTGRMVGLVPKF